MIRLNDKNIETDLREGTIKQLIKKLGLDEQEVVVLKNNKVVMDYNSSFSRNDLVEIISVHSRG